MAAAPPSRKGERAELITALLQPGCYPHSVGTVRLIETHISWVLLTGYWAYKIKKPVDLGFLDFTTLEARRDFCDQELRLNRRLAPQIYEAVVPIVGTPAAPRIESPGQAIEYAVKMREFPQDALASEMLARDALTPHHVDVLAQLVADFHGRAARADSESDFGTPEAVLKPALDNFEVLQQCGSDAAGEGTLRTLRLWTEREYAARARAFAERRSTGFIRECHGDLHLRNIAVLRGGPVPFDCIEFNERLRWIDVMSEIAFVVMDFEDRRRSDLGWRFLNRYLEATGDYGGLELMRFYAVYRALVRAKVHALRARQPHIAPRERARLDAVVMEYLELATRLAQSAKQAIVITHGLSGSGKTTATQAMIERLGAIRVRTDNERKRMAGMCALARTGSAPDAGLYTKEFTVATYARLQATVRSIVQAGYTAIVDAAFLKRSERDTFRDLAATLNVPFVILALEAPREVLMERVQQRLEGAADASEADPAVLQRQFASYDPIGADEESAALRVNTNEPVPASAWERLVQRL